MKGTFYYTWVKQTKKPTQMHRLIFSGANDSLHRVDLLLELGLKVGSLVLVDDGTLG